MGDLSRELEVVRALVLRAGDLVMSHYGRVAAETKGSGTEPVTAADRETNRLLVQGIAAAFPEDGVLAEESAPHPEWWKRRRVWCIDPIDGTKEFIAQNGEFAVMVGLADGADAVLGFVLLPARRRLYWGGPDLGAFSEDLDTGGVTLLRVSERDDFGEMTMAISRSHRSARVSEMAERLGVTREVRSGSVGVKLGLVAEARADLYLHPSRGTKRWDACGPDALLAGAGGVLTDFHGRRICYDSDEVHNTAGLLASNGRRHREIVDRVRAVTAAAGL